VDCFDSRWNSQAELVVVETTKLAWKALLPVVSDHQTHLVRQVRPLAQKTLKMGYGWRVELEGDPSLHGPLFDEAEAKLASESCQ
jgi:hypothetical protein